MKYCCTLPIFTSSFLVTTLFCGDISLLSPEKQRYYEQQQQQINAGYERLRYDWLSPITLKASNTYEKSVSLGGYDSRQNISAGMAQDLFRSGGIAYTIGYAEAKKQTDTIGMHKDIAAINQQFINTLLNYRKNTLLLEQSEIKLKNGKIEIFLKRKQYEAGDIDITLLNNALMNQSSELKNNTSIRYTLSQLRLEALKYSNHPIEGTELPVFTLVQKNDFLEEGWSFRYSQAQSQSSEQQYGQTKSSYLPKLTLIADAGVQRFDSSELSSANYRGNYYDMGLQLSMPLTYNSTATIQEAQSLYLKQQAEASDIKRQMDAQYEQSIAHIESYKRVIAITGENLKFYEELIDATKAAVNAGYKAGYDLQTLQNTKSIEELEIKINEINIQIELASLYTLTRHSQELAL
ncbi:TolC family protein [Sulfuricurvum sp.]|uniref:TolC family protein n=1 Tax=Sulfuricurvum sp. TaxID=2025608 RepID=UPI003562A776